MHSDDNVAAVLALVDRGFNDCHIGRLTGVPRRTILDWRHGRAPDRSLRDELCDVCAGRAPSPPPSEYSYVLGLYLGDGCISKGARTHRLRITLDAAYPGIISECTAALETIRPEKRAWQGLRQDCRCVEVVMHWNHWPCLFPQHGPGRKHDRKIRLEPWQEAVVGGHRRALLRGLIHSDGCRVVANDRGRPSVRYHFSNRSEDIKKIYCDNLDVLGISWTRPCNQQIAVYRKASTARMDNFIGPKR